MTEYIYGPVFRDNGRLYRWRRRSIEALEAPPTQNVATAAQPDMNGRTKEQVLRLNHLLHVEGKLCLQSGTQACTEMMFFVPQTRCARSGDGGLYVAFAAEQEQELEEGVAQHIFCKNRDFAWRVDAVKRAEACSLDGFVCEQPDDTKDDGGRDDYEEDDEEAVGSLVSPSGSSLFQQQQHQRPQLLPTQGGMEINMRMSVNEHPNSLAHSDNEDELDEVLDNGENAPGFDSIDDLPQQERPATLKHVKGMPTQVIVNTTNHDEEYNDTNLSAVTTARSEPTARGPMPPPTDVANGRAKVKKVTNGDQDLVEELGDAPATSPFLGGITRFFRW